MRLGLLLSLIPGGLLAQTPLTGAEFNARVAGGTFVINVPGQEPYGIEAYLPNRQVMWGYLGGDCTAGEWYETTPGTICFEYDGLGDGPTCWNYFETDGQFLASLIDDENQPMYEKVETDLTVDCVDAFLGS